jgi:tRNA(Ile2)-agmatinylcytidine synthase
MRLVRKCGNEAATYCGQLGLVGAVAAIGHVLNSDHTFELVAYRVKQNWGRQRLVDENSVKRMDRSTRPMTFNNYDYENERMLITPHGPDPVLLGIRGENPRTVLQGFRMLRIHEPIERWVIFRTNHGTDAHFEHSSMNVRPYRPVILKGIVRGNPRRTPGGHVIFTLDFRGKTLECAAYEPTGSFRERVAKLIHGDKVTCFGSIREPRTGTPLTINLEKIRVDKLADDIQLENPICPQCTKHMKSAGKGQGFRCKRCSITAPKAGKQMSKKQRTLQIGVYIPTPRAHRHLTKPLSRYGREKTKWGGQPPSGDWHNP